MFIADVQNSLQLSQASQGEQEKYCLGQEVRIASHRFRCVEPLGRGSYSEVWRADVLAGESGCESVALKEVLCRSDMELQQAIFEVQVLHELEESMKRSALTPICVPRCIAYRVDPCMGGLKVRTAMTVVPGECLNLFIQRPPKPGSTRADSIALACAWAAKLLRDIGTTLQLLAPIAWHRDVNSHNILFDFPQDATSIDDLSQRAFWLIDFGLAVDSDSWVRGRWQTQDIGGDSRYWPPSSWIMHLMGPEGFWGRECFREQYQRRLDIHGLGITALELLCTVAESAPLDPDDGIDGERQEAWANIFVQWHRYREDMWNWWSRVYTVFQAGGDISAVQLQMLQERVVSQLVLLLENVRLALRKGAMAELGAASSLLTVIADMIDETCYFRLEDMHEKLTGGAVCPSMAKQGTSVGVVDSRLVNACRPTPSSDQARLGLATWRVPSAEPGPPRPLGAQLGGLVCRSPERSSPPPQMIVSPAPKIQRSQSLHTYPSFLVASSTSPVPLPSVQRFRSAVIPTPPTLHSSALVNTPRRTVSPTPVNRLVRSASDNLSPQELEHHMQRASSWESRFDKSRLVARSDDQAHSLGAQAEHLQSMQVLSATRARLRPSSHCALGSHTNQPVHTSILPRMSLKAKDANDVGMLAGAYRNSVPPPSCSPSLVGVAASPKQPTQREPGQFLPLPRRIVPAGSPSPAMPQSAVNSARGSWRDPPSASAVCREGDMGVPKARSKLLSHRQVWSNGSLPCTEEQAQKNTPGKLADRMRELEVHWKAHEKLRERIENLERSIRRLGQDSLKSAKLRLDALAVEFFNETQREVSE